MPATSQSARILAGYTAGLEAVANSKIFEIFPAYPARYSAENWPDSMNSTRPKKFFFLRLNSEHVRNPTKTYKLYLVTRDHTFTSIYAIPPEETLLYIHTWVRLQIKSVIEMRYI